MQVKSSNYLTLTGIAGQAEWPFRGPSGVCTVAVSGDVTLNNAESMYELALLELGVIRLSDITVGPAIRSGRLVPILVDAHQPEPLPLHAVYTPTRCRPPKVDAVIQFLVERFAAVPWRLPHPVGKLPTRRGARKPRPIR